MDKETKRLSKKFNVPVMKMDLVGQIQGMKKILKEEFGINTEGRGWTVGKLRDEFESQATKEQKKKYNGAFYDFY